MPSQQATTGSAPIEGVERMNVVVVRGSEQEIRALRRDSYVMEVDRERNCYTYESFGHMACYCKN